MSAKFDLSQEINEELKSNGRRRNDKKINTSAPFKTVGREESFINRVILSYEVTLKVNEKRQV